MSPTRPNQITIGWTGDADMTPQGWANAISYAGGAFAGKSGTCAHACIRVVSRVDGGCAGGRGAFRLAGVDAVAPAFRLPFPPHRRACRHAGATAGFSR